MTTAVASAPILPQLEGANLLNLMIVDDERAIREACREVAQSLGFNTCVADSAEHSYRMLDAGQEPLPGIDEFSQTDSNQPSPL